ncbi:MAG: hypothetical protein IKF72_11530 [Kiritimatiellae bacterium]|nr:hypothetical protein [Kiritimatiellia bacterium]
MQEPHGACPHTHSETYGAAGLVDDVLVIARAHTEAKMQEAVGRYVKGTGAAAERLHGIVEARIRTDPASPDTVVMNAHQLVVGPMLNQTIVMDMQSFATGQQTQFDLDRHRQFPARLAGIGEVSEDPAVARDQFARFVTKNPSATYASLDPVTRNKANFAMTLVSQGTHNAVLFGFGIALDPDRSKANVSFAVTGDIERSFELEFDVNGGLNLRFRARQKATAVVTSGDATPCGPGSAVTSKPDPDKKEERELYVKCFCTPKRQLCMGTLLHTVDKLCLKQAENSSFFMVVHPMATGCPQLLPAYVGEYSRPVLWSEHRTSSSFLIT